MKINGIDVKPGDKVWHLLLGEGTVTEVMNDGNARVTFGTVNYLFSSALRRPGEPKRTLYWQNPIMFDPPHPSQTSHWSALRDIVDVMADKIIRIKLVEA